MYRPWDILGPFWPKSNDAKRGQWVRPLGSNPQVGPPGPIFGHQSQKTKTVPNPQMSIFSLGLGTIHKWPLEITRGLQTLHFQAFLLEIREGLFPLLDPKAAGTLDGACMVYIPLCTIFLSNSMVNLSGPNSSISSHVPIGKSISREDAKISS
ncbi:hypothetical protein O181_119013 [Austropuccinia psidii MF-1]|uniref:Uncharacterized protein n=1 Tax=Austropuccinia psidii MF-1 TaxID=1389203 RepID=A0A9Q3KD18_9BASI|nr:hypothetical protein [Austropuccinia psidii MF-1]